MSAFDNPPGRPATVIEETAKRLRDAIMRGELRPGQKLVEADLCRSMGISRASLREALRRLEAERLIELFPHRGPFVARLGWKEVEDIHAVWAMLTGEAVLHFTEIADGDDILELERARAAFDLALQAHNSLQELDATNSFFHRILHRNENAVLIDMVERLSARVNFLRAQALHQEGWGHVCLQELDDIIAAIGARRPGQARAATVRHINSAASAAKQVVLMTGLAARRNSQAPTVLAAGVSPSDAEARVADPSGPLRGVRGKARRKAVEDTE